MAQITPQQMEARRAEIRAKRIATLLGAYDLMRERYQEIHDGTTLNKQQVAVVVEEYIQEREKLVHRHKNVAFSRANDWRDDSY